MAATNVVFDQNRPLRQGNTGFGYMTGTLIDTAISYSDVIAAVQGRFKTSPPVRVNYILTPTTNTYAFFAYGRAI
jgi:hypothetical protein